MPDEFLLLFGRLPLGGLFVVGGIRHFTILDPLSTVLSVKKFPYPRTSLMAATVFEIACGALLVAGKFVEWAATGLIAFTVIVTVVMLDFWNQEGEARAVSVSAWMTNVAIVGGLLIAISSA